MVESKSGFQVVKFKELRILKQIGDGNFGKVYLAECKWLCGCFVFVYVCRLLMCACFALFGLGLLFDCHFPALAFIYFLAKDFILVGLALILCVCVCLCF